MWCLEQSATNLKLSVAELGRAVLGTLDAHLLVDDSAQLAGRGPR